MLTSTIPSVLVSLAAVLVPGTPLALLVLRRLRPGLAVVLATAAGLGTCLWLFVGVFAVHHGLFRRRPLVVAVALIAAVAWVLARREVSMLRPRRPGWLAAALAVLSVPALALRDDPVYFAYQVADFGEYVNRGNVIADGGRFGSYFVNGFPALLGESHLLFGEAGTVQIMPFTGLLAAALVLATLHVVGAGRGVVAAVAVLVTFQVHWVWFSQFPASETLYAVLLALAVLLGVAGLRGRDHAPSLAVGGVAVLLAITRGNALVLLPVIALALAAVPVLIDAGRASLVRGHLLAFGGGIWSGSVYDARFNPTYFLDAQAAPRLPGPVADLFVRLDEPVVALGFSIAVAIALALAAAVGLVLERIRVAPAVWAWVRRGAVVSMFAVVVAAHVFVISSAAYLPRYAALGPATWAAVAVALGVLSWGRVGDDVARFAISWPLLLVLTMATFQASRLTKSITVDAPWFLYWDRYYFSEVFPMALVAGGTAAGIAWSTVAARGSRPVTFAAAAVIAALTLATVVDVAPGTARASEQEMFDDTYEELATLDRLMAEPIPIVYDGLQAFPEGWFWSNSSRVLAEPLRETFARRVLNPAGATSRDPTPDSRDVEALLRSAGVEDAFVLQVSDRPAWPAIDATILGVSEVAELAIRIERLEGRSAPAPRDQRWIPTVLHVRILRIARLAPAA